ncbi:MAG: hypothetical protein JNL82_42225 [Myxococcales bacterium]|nr:hypothetical protein [Myxococcales bacterium]
MRGRALGVVLLAGCVAGGGPATEPAREVTASAVEAVEQKTEAIASTAKALEMHEVICERAVRCGQIGRSQLADCLMGPDGSRLTLVWGFERSLRIPELVAQMRLRPVPGSAQACLEFLAKAPCVYDRTQAPEGCGHGSRVEQLAPTVRPGERCTRWEECIDGFCAAQTACEGVCVARSPVGGACGSGQICTDDAYCWQGTCRARAGAGEACGGHWQWCRDGLWCDGYRPESESRHHHRPEQQGKCSPGRGEGEPCAPEHSMEDELCAPGLFCDWGEDRPVCRRPLAEGEACGWLDACADGLHCAGLELGGGHPAGHKFGVRKRGACTRALDAGDACDPRAFVSGCPQAMRCDADKRVCRSTGHAGDPCVSSWVTKPQPPDVPLRNEGCFGGHYCEVATRTCQRQKLQGERCTPQKFGEEDSPCFLGECDASTRRCLVECGGK